MQGHMDAQMMILCNVFQENPFNSLLASTPDPTYDYCRGSSASMSHCLWDLPTTHRRSGCVGPLREGEFRGKKLSSHPSVLLCCLYVITNSNNRSPSGPKFDPDVCLWCRDQSQVRYVHRMSSHLRSEHQCSRGSVSLTLLSYIFR